MLNTDSCKKNPKIIRILYNHAIQQKSRIQKSHYSVVSFQNSLWNLHCLDAAGNAIWIGRHIGCTRGDAISGVCLAADFAGRIERGYRCREYRPFNQKTRFQVIGNRSVRALDIIVR